MKEFLKKPLEEILNKTGRIQDRIPEEISVEIERSIWEGIH